MTQPNPTGPYTPRSTHARDHNQGHYAGGPAYSSYQPQTSPTTTACSSSSQQRKENNDAARRHEAESAIWDEIQDQYQWLFFTPSSVWTETLW